MDNPEIPSQVFAHFGAGESINVGSINQEIDSKPIEDFSATNANFSTGQKMGSPLTPKRLPNDSSLPYMTDANPFFNAKLDNDCKNDMGNYSREHRNEVQNPFINCDESQNFERGYLKHGTSEINNTNFDERERDDLHVWSQMSESGVSDKRSKHKEKHKRKHHTSKHSSRAYAPDFDPMYNPEINSRASSRSGSVHNSFQGHEYDSDKAERRRHREKERYSRHPNSTYYTPYMHGYSMEMYHRYMQQYQFYENMRKMNPQNYAQIYKKYYNQGADTLMAKSNDYRNPMYPGSNDQRYQQRHEMINENVDVYGNFTDVDDPRILDEYSFNRGLDSQIASSTISDDVSSKVQQQRHTPTKFSTAHSKAVIHGDKLLQIAYDSTLEYSTYPVKICDITSLFNNDAEYIEMTAFDGPLIKGVTHKKTIIEYCENKIATYRRSHKNEDSSSYILLMKFLLLVIRQNGVVIGDDISDLLLHQSFETSKSIDKVTMESKDAGSRLTDFSPITSDQQTDLNGFREKLLYGDINGALEWATQQGLWGHALFLASKLDESKYNNVVLRFTNNIPKSDPLQTLYQLLAGKIPSASQCLSDDKLDDWRSHLAMMVSNIQLKKDVSDVIYKSIMVLGDSLLNKNNLYAAQLCYTIAYFSNCGNNDPFKLILLDAAQGNLGNEIHEASLLETLHLTEVIEYAMRLNDAAFTIQSLQIKKLAIASHLADFGLFSKSLLYLEQLADYIKSIRTFNESEENFLDHVIHLSERILLLYRNGDESLIDSASADTCQYLWLKELKEMGVNRNKKQDVSDGLYKVLPNGIYTPSDPNNNVALSSSVAHHPAIPYTPTINLNSNVVPIVPTNEPVPFIPTQNFNSQQIFDPYVPTLDDITSSQPTFHAPKITLPNSQSRHTDDISDSTHASSYAGTTKVGEPSHASNAGGQSSKHGQDANDQGGKTWLGDIFSKLSLKPKNQIKLPDDKNPSIIWDEQKKQWINTTEDKSESARKFQPPPKMSDMRPMQHQLGQQPLVPMTTGGHNSLVLNDMPSNINMGPPGQANLFKMQRNRGGLKKAYVDVLNPNSQNDKQNVPSIPMSVGFSNDQGAQISPQINLYQPQPPGANYSNDPSNFAPSNSTPAMV